MTQKIGTNFLNSAAFQILICVDSAHYLYLGAKCTSTIWNPEYPVTETQMRKLCLYQRLGAKTDRWCWWELQIGRRRFHRENLRMRQKIARAARALSMQGCGVQRQFLSMVVAVRRYAAQALSIRADLLSPAYLEALTELQEMMCNLRKVHNIHCTWDLWSMCHLGR